MPAHVFRHRVDDRLQVLLLVWLRALLGKLQTFVAPAAVDQVLDQAGQRLAQNRVHGRTEERFEPAFHVQQEDNRVVQSLQEHRGPLSCPGAMTPGSARQRSIIRGGN